MDGTVYGNNSVRTVRRTAISAYGRYGVRQFQRTDGMVYGNISVRMVWCTVISAYGLYGVRHSPVGNNESPVALLSQVQITIIESSINLWMKGV
ncbi:hypothetical protein M8J75_014520 [Diaphorina citri]|nr:hypothetical protein M8J75_014520 [Diaphorina citri]